MEHHRSAVVAFGFGEPCDAHPNARIADRALVLARDRGAELVFTDRDVSPHLPKGDIAVEEISSKLVPTTYRLALLAAEGAKRHRLDTLYVVAARCHMGRCLRDLRWAAHDCGIKIALIPRAIEGYQYDPAAATFVTRSAWRWWPFEIAYRTVSAFAPGWYKRTRA